MYISEVLSSATSNFDLMTYIERASEVINKPAIDMCEYIKDLMETRRKEEKKQIEMGARKVVAFDKD